MIDIQDLVYASGTLVDVHVDGGGSLDGYLDQLVHLHLAPLDQLGSQVVDDALRVLHHVTHFASLQPEYPT